MISRRGLKLSGQRNVDGTSIHLLWYLRHVPVIYRAFRFARPVALNKDCRATKAWRRIDPFAYIVRDFPAMSPTSTIDSRPPLDPRAPYQFNPGAKLYVRDRIALTFRGERFLSGYFGGSDYDVKDLFVSPDGERITFAAHGPAGTSTTDLEYLRIRLYNRPGSPVSGGR